MKEKKTLKRIFRTEEDWLEEVFSQSNSQGSLKLAKTAHNKVPIFQCKHCDEVLRGTMNFDKHLTLVHGTTHWDLHLAIRETKLMMKELIGFN